MVSVFFLLLYFFLAVVSSRVSSIYGIGIGGTGFGTLDDPVYGFDKIDGWLLYGFVYFRKTREFLGCCRSLATFPDVERVMRGLGNTSGGSWGGFGRSVPLFAFEQWIGSVNIVVPAVLRVLLGFVLNKRRVCLDIIIFIRFCQEYYYRSSSVEYFYSILPK